MNATPDEQAALLRAIVANVGDDAPRLVYADWLEEHDDAGQAAFVRDSVALARMSKRQKGRKALERKVRERTADRDAPWLVPLGVTPMFRVERYSRGFPERVSYSALEELFEAADRLFDLLPVRGIEIESGSGADAEVMMRLADAPWLSRLTDLRLFHHDSIAPGVWEEFFRSPRLSGLTHLTLGNCGMFEEETAHLAAAPVFANLVSLDLGYNGIGVDGAQALLDSPHLKGLKTLCLEHNFFGEDEDEDAVLEALEMRFGEGLVFDPPEDEDEDA